MKFNYIHTLLVGISLLSFYGCNDKLDMSPESSITPDKYLWEESQLAAYTVNRYDYLPAPLDVGSFAADNHTDIQANQSVPNEFITGEYKVKLNGGAWNFEEIYQINYFLNVVIPRYEAGQLRGNDDMLRHYIGEMYFFRAQQYYGKLVSLGDFPILMVNLPDDITILTAESKRMPRTEVARFILSDLDKAIEMMRPNAPDGRKNRLSVPVAQLLKSRVALFEATWLKYFKGTAFVPNGPNWPGASKAYNQGYQFQSGDIDEEINWLLNQAIEAADAVASSKGLTSNTGVLPQSEVDKNPFVEMYSAIDMSSYEEVLLWKDFDRGLGVTNNIPVNSSTSNFGIGITRGMVNNFLMDNGLPYYAQGSNYQGDESIGCIRANRDNRAMLFLKEPMQFNMWINIDQGSHGAIQEPILPNITSGTVQHRYNTGYTSRKGVNPDKALCDNWGGYNGLIIYRSAEAYLNYIEAYYERFNRLDDKATRYWKALRNRAGIDEDIQKTIDATDMTKESEFNWSAYSGGKLVDKTLYNIRRERVCEFMGEGLRKTDLKRWRSMDQLITSPFHIEGLKIWGDYYKQRYKDEALKDETYHLVYGADNKDANVSSPVLSQYLRPFQISRTLAYDGYTWHMAHYLEPISIKHIRITSSKGDYSTSPIYQNPYWTLTPDTPAEK